MNKTIPFLIMIVLFFSSCNVTKQMVPPTSLGQSWNLQELEARHYDIPLMFDAKPLETSQSSSMIAYQSTMLSDQIIDFYRQQMDIVGWSLLSCIEDRETMLLFEKPRKYATIIIRSNNNIQTVVIFISSKPNFALASCFV